MLMRVLVCPWRHRIALCHDSRSYAFAPHRRAAASDHLRPRHWCRRVREPIVHPCVPLDCVALGHRAGEPPAKLAGARAPVVGFPAGTVARKSLFN